MSSVDAAVQAALIAVKRNQPPPILWPATITDGDDPKQTFLRLDGHDADSGAQSLLGQLQDGERVMTILSPPQLVLVVSVIATPWVAVTFENSWVDFGAEYQVCQYRRDANGCVEIRGVCKDGTVNTTVFTLPPGFRPPGRLVFPGYAHSAVCRLDIATTGVVQQLTAAGTGFLGLNYRFSTI